MWPGTANSGGGRSPQASAGTPNNTREPARSDKKKPQPRTVGVLLLVEPGGIEPPSASPLQTDLHTYPPYLDLTPDLAGRQAGQRRVTLPLAVEPSNPAQLAILCK